MRSSIVKSKKNNSECSMFEDEEVKQCYLLSKSIPRSKPAAIDERERCGGPLWPSHRVADLGAQSNRQDPTTCCGARLRSGGYSFQVNKPSTR